MDNNGSLLYFMPGYNPYAGQTFLGVDGQNRHFPSSEGMPRYLWNSAYSDAGYQNSTSWGSKSAMVSNGLMKSNAFSSQRFPNYLLDDIQSTSNISQSFLQTPQLYSVNKVCNPFFKVHFFCPIITMIELTHSLIRVLILPKMTLDITKRTKINVTNAF